MIFIATPDSEPPQKAGAEESEEGKKNPVLLIHGYMGSIVMPWWKILELRLIDAGYKEEHIHKIDLSGLNLPGIAVKSPKVYSKKIKSRVEKISNIPREYIKEISDKIQKLLENSEKSNEGIEEKVENIIKTSREDIESLRSEIENVLNIPRTDAGNIAEEIEKIQDKNGDKKVDIIAHSMGGLDARWYIEKLGGSEYVDKLITLGTPHNGTYLAYLVFFTPGGRDMIPGSEFLEELNKDSLAQGVDYTSVWSDGDYAIIPKEKAKLEGAKNINPGFFPHIMLVWSGEVFRKAILPALRGEL